MIFRVLFTLNKVRKTPITTGYRPTWICDSKPEHSTGALSIEGQDSIVPGESCETCYLEPLAPQLWKNVKHGDILKCMEGTVEVGSAVVMAIFDEFRFPTIEFPSKEAKEQYDKLMNDMGFNELSASPTINVNDVTRRRFRIK